jgi:hypothetical protein
MSHGRKYGEKESRPIPLWNGVFEHYHRIGDALWEFLWCVDAITKEKDGIGLVLGGTPVKLKRIVADLKADKETVRRHLKNLADENYIRVRRTPYGQIIEVLNSKKFGIWHKEKPQNAVSPSIEKPIHEHEKPIHESEKPQNAVSKEDSAVTQQGRSSVRLPLASFWQEIGVAPERLSGGVRKLGEDLYVTKGNQSPVEFLSAYMDAIQAMGWSIPPQVAQAKAELKANGNGHHHQVMRELEAEPSGAGSGVRQ